MAEYDGNEKTLNGFYASKVLKGLPLNWQERDQLLAIAKQCPQKGGAVVYWARAWYAHLKGVEVQEEDCVVKRESGAGSDKLLTDSSEFRLFPNPASESFTVSGPIVPDGDDWKIELFSAMGQLVRQYNYSSNGWTELQLQGIPTGVYWCKILSGNRQFATQKISIIK